ncbi:hypothetical protein [Singulisphaera acidiphila]|uniref:Uncharacterized protein n=1 Tax=Singulisphaera acidiphila (strain ATCC BAA-1392 / DSM 18658 / VKM B-2454 / MOB10) TaxID=886293 RepID=L0DGG3_SINAD|nr:hypothetical protein [Singulisphaera acidiphila]AGA28469.1 hypothetical protein Sinac_4270 [Singulisphaera acidiphila DSM 18658]
MCPNNLVLDPENSANVTIDEDPERWPNDQQASADPSQIATTQVAMSWYLTVAEQLAMDRAIPSDAATEKAFGDVDQKTKRVERLNALKNEAFKTVWAPDARPTCTSSTSEP